MKKILILNVGWANKGNVALVKSTMQTITNFVDNVQFNLMGPDALVTNDFCTREQLGWAISREKPLYYPIRSIFYLFDCVFINFLGKLNINLSISKNSRLFEYFDADLVINSGGDHLSGEYGISTLNAFTNIIYAILLGKPVILYGESLGYFRNPILNYIAKLILNKTKLILVRESISKKYLDCNDINNPRIYFTGEPAFLLEPAPQAQVFNILAQEGINEIKRPLIGINASSLISRFQDGNARNNGKKIEYIFANVIDNLIENLNATIIMIPHVYAKGNDDRVTIFNITNNVKNKQNVVSIQNEYSPEELKGIIGLCDLFIGARMHATVASTSMLVPTVGIAYSHKMHGIIGEMLEQDNYIIDINDFNYENLLSKIYDVWNNKESIQAKLNIRIPFVKERATLNGKYTKELLDSL